MGGVISKIQHFGRIVFVFSMLFSSEGFAQAKLSDGIVEYQMVEDKESVLGTLKCKGSTNIAKFLEIWLSEFQEFYPNINTEMDFVGTGQGIKGLMDGSANIGAASRKIKIEEVNKFKRTKGYEPTEIKISIDALAIYVNRLNSIDTITLEELDAIFSSQPQQGYGELITRWNLLTGRNKKINVYLFDKNSGTRSYFKKSVMLQGEFNEENIVSDEFKTRTELIDALSQDPYGIGFGSMGANNFKVKTVALAKRDQFPAYKASSTNIENKNYPLVRFFYIYLDVPPHKTIPKLMYEFCKFILSKNGQEALVKAGGFALSPREIGIELSKIRRSE